MLAVWPPDPTTAPVRARVASFRAGVVPAIEPVTVTLAVLDGALKAFAARRRVERALVQVLLPRLGRGGRLLGSPQPVAVTAHPWVGAKPSGEPREPAQSAGEAEGGDAGGGTVGRCRGRYPSHRPFVTGGHRLRCTLADTTSPRSTRSTATKNKTAGGTRRDKQIGVHT